MSLALIVAMTRQGVIGLDNKMPWHLPGDMKRFKSLTWGHPVIMGRKTFESIGRPLPGRRNIVLTRGDWQLPPMTGLAPDTTIEIASSLPQALASCDPLHENFVIGGGEIYRLALPLADKLYVTWVEEEVAGDAHFPTWSPQEFRVVFEEAHAEPRPHRFVDYVRKT